MADIIVPWASLLAAGDRHNPNILIKLVDNGDGSYSLGTSSGGGGGSAKQTISGGGNSAFSGGAHYYNLGAQYEAAPGVNASNWAGNGYLFSRPGTISNLIVLIDAAAGVNGEIFKIYKNGVLQTLGVTITNGNKSGGDTSNTLTVVRGDIVSILYDINASDFNFTKASWSCDFDPS